MNRPIPWLITALLASAGTTHAATPADVCTNLAEARSQLVAMLGSTDPATLAGLKTKVHASSEVDADLGAMAGGPDAAKVAAFKPVRGNFKKTREGGIIPAIYAGKTADSNALATGIKAERTKTLKAGMGCN